MRASWQGLVFNPFRMGNKVKEDGFRLVIPTTFETHLSPCSPKTFDPPEVIRMVLKHFLLLTRWKSVFAQLFCKQEIRLLKTWMMSFAIDKTSIGPCNLRDACLRLERCAPAPTKDISFERPKIGRMYYGTGTSDHMPGKSEESLFFLPSLPSWEGVFLARKLGTLLLCIHRPSPLLMQRLSHSEILP